MNDLADLADFNQILRRVGRDDEHIRMRLNEDAGLFFVGFAQLFAGGQGFGDADVEVGGFSDAFAVAADAAVVGQAVCLNRREAVDEAREHERQRVFACAFGSGEDDGLRDALVKDALAQPLDRARIAEEFCKTHKDEATRNAEFARIGWARL